MPLQDLKKQAFANKRKRIKVSADEFIDQASLYAQGLPIQTGANCSNVIDFVTGKPTFVVLGCVGKNNTNSQSSDEKPSFKNATFSLSYQAIEQLSQIAQETQLAKSHILRILIDANTKKPIQLTRYDERSKTR